MRLEGFDKLNREEAGFLCKILGASEVAGSGGVARLLHESPDLFFEIFLGGAVSLAAGLLKISLGDVEVFLGLALIAGLLFR